MRREFSECPYWRSACLRDGADRFSSEIVRSGTQDNDHALPRDPLASV